jgi:hypothetical protein
VRVLTHKSRQEIKTRKMESAAKLRRLNYLRQQPMLLIFLGGMNVVSDIICEYKTRSHSVSQRRLGNCPSD